MNSVRPGRALLAILIVLGALLCVPSAQAADTTLVPFGSSGFKYRQGPAGWGQGFQAPAFDDGTWATGAAAFGNPQGSCGLPVATNWIGDNSDLLTRRAVAVPTGATNVRIQGRVDDGVQIFWRGVQIFDGLSRSACATSGIDFDATVPAGQVNAGASNLLAIRARNGGGNQIFDVRVVADVPTDLAMAVSATPVPVRAGDPLAVTYRVTNNGPTASSASTFVAEIPTQTSLAAAPSGCTLSGTRLTCAVPSLAVGASSARTITYAVSPRATGTIAPAATAVLGPTTGDGNPGNDTASTTAQVQDSADLSLTKTVDDANATPGATRTFRLVARNDGPVDARGVTVTDTLPSGVTFAGASAGCTRTGAVVSCTADRLDSGATRTFDVQVTVDPVVVPADHQHGLAIGKVERQVDLDPGQTVTADLACTDGGRLTDATFELDHVDQGTGTSADVELTRLVSTGVDRTSATVVNRATGRAQGKLFAVCLPARTDDAAGHAHDISIGGLRTANVPAGAGRRTAVVTCPTGSIVAAPGFEVVGGAARLVGSQRSGTSRTFTVDVADAGAVVTVSGRCLDLRTATTDGHAHDLVVDDLDRTVTVPAGATVVEPLICADDAKGVVGSFLAPAGLLVTGNQPQPKSRVFTLENTTGGPLDVRLGLTCVKDRTTNPVVAQRIVNTATLTNDAPVRDPDSDDRTASATILVVAGAPQPAANPAPVASAASPTPSPLAAAAVAPGPSAAAVASGTTRAARSATLGSAARLAPGGRAAAVPVTCAAACRGTITLMTVRSTGGLRSGRVVGAARFANAAGGRTVRVALTRKAARQARRGTLRRLRVVVRQDGVARPTVRTIRLVRR